MLDKFYGGLIIFLPIAIFLVALISCIRAVLKKQRFSVQTFVILIASFLWNVVVWWASFRL